MTVFIVLVAVSLLLAALAIHHRTRRRPFGFGGLVAGVAWVAVLTLPQAGAAAEIEGKAGEFGIGAVIPDPIGVTAKWFFIDRQAVEVAAGFDGADEDELVVRGSYLYHFTEIWNIPRGDLPLYLGAGGRFEWDDDEDDVGVGIRIPVGVAWWMDRYPFEVFGELAPLFEIEPDDDISLTVAAGIRWYP